MNPRHVTVRDVRIGNDLPLVLIAGPCALESRAHALEVSAALVEITGKLGIKLIYKTSFDKANRTSLSGARGVGFEAGLPILAEIRETRGIPVLTDVHLPEQCAPTAEAADILQIPAYLCRQTDLLVAAARTGSRDQRQEGPVPGAMGHEERRRQDRERPNGEKNERILLCERGASFGYNTLVSDMRVIADPGRDRLPGGVRRNAFGAAARRPGRKKRRRAPLCRDAGARRGRGRGRGGVHGNPRRPRPRPLRRPEHGAAEGVAGVA